MNMEQRRLSEEDMKQQQDQMKPSEIQTAGHHHHHQPPPSQKCPRCDSSNTKFCYYNNYSLSQPRYFCKACRRYWTHGGTLRNVPVGGGCRKSKRSRTSAASSSGGDVTRAHSFSSAIPRPQNCAGMISGQASRAALPPVIPPIINSFYSHGAMQTLPAGISERAALGHGGGGGCHFGTNMALLQGMSLSPIKPHGQPQQFPGQNTFFSSQESLILPRPLMSWTQSLINSTAANSSAGSSSFWSGGGGACNTVDDGNQAGSSFNPNQWSSNKHPGFDPSQP